jgi:hypothetical protein
MVGPTSFDRAGGRARTDTPELGVVEALETLAHALSHLADGSMPLQD